MKVGDAGTRYLILSEKPGHNCDCNAHWSTGMTRTRTEGFVETPTIRHKNITLHVISEHFTDRTTPSLRAVHLGQHRRHARQH
jgi:hypothetical protein